MTANTGAANFGEATTLEGPDRRLALLSWRHDVMAVPEIVSRAGKIAGTLALAYVLVVAGCYAVQRSLMYFPDDRLPSPAAAGVAEMAAVTLTTADGLELVSWYAAPATPERPAIAYFHGNAGNIAYRASKARPYLDRGYGVLLLSYRGYGGNPGAPSEQGLIADGRAALDFLAARGVAPERTVIYGESLGSGVAVAVAAERRVAAVILEAPFTSAAAVGQRAYPFLPVALLIKDRFDSLARVAAIAAPLLIIHGEADRVVPVDEGRRLLAAAAAPKEGVFLPGATHNDLYRHGAAEIVIAFLERLFGG